MNEEKLSLAGVEVRELMNRLMNNTMLVRVIIGKFLEDQTFESLKAAVASGDMKAAEFACHSLKGVCGNLSLKKLFALFQEQLGLFRGGDHAAAVAMMDVIGPEYEHAVHQLKQWLAEQ